MARVYRRKVGGKDLGWYCDFRHGGRRYVELAGKDIKESDAQQFLAKRMREVQREDIYDPKPAPAPSFGDFADKRLVEVPQKSRDRIRPIMEMLKAEWAGKRLDEITREMIADLRRKRLEEVRAAAATVAKEITIIKWLFQVALEDGKIKKSPASKIKRPVVDNTRVRFLEPKEIERLMNALPDWMRPYAVFARFTAARRGEMLNLTWNDVDFKRGIITFRDAKAGTGNVIMNDTARALLHSLPSPRDRAQRVFPEYHQAPNKPTWLVQFNRAWRRACKTAGISDFHWHDLRHQAATDLLTAGANLNDVRDFLRHKGVAMTLRYGHLIQDRRKETAKSMDILATKAATGL
jgi:integrase